MGRRHLHGYAALVSATRHEFRLSAVCDPQPAAAEAAADLVEAFQGSRPAVFASHEELIASGVASALDIVTDPSVHHVVAVPALDQGLHVICEKPLGITVRACRAIVDAAERSGALLATAENYRRDPPNRLARAVLEQELLGELHLLMQYDVGGSNDVIISPWRHMREAGSIALDMAVHYTDMFAFFLGELESVSGTAFIAEPLRVLAPGAPNAAAAQESPGVIRATGDDSIVALYESAAGVLVQLAYVPSGPGHHWLQRTVHGRNGSMSIPPDRSGGEVVVRLGETTLSGDALRRELGGFKLDGITAELFGRTGTAYDLPFADVDAALIAIELEDFIGAVIERRPPEVDGRAGLAAVAAVWGAAESEKAGRVFLEDVVSGAVSMAQDPIDRAIGLLHEEDQVPA